MTQLQEIEDYLQSNYDIRENVINGMLYYRKKKASQYHIINENTLWRELLHARFKIKIPDLINLLKSDFTQKFDPMIDYFKAFENVQIKTDHIDKLCGYIKVKGDQKLFNLAFKKHLVRAVACAIRENSFNKHCFVFVSKEQNNGKSTFCRWLNPPELKSYYAENITTDKDSLIALCENFIINLDELSTLMKSEINSLKSFFSKDYIKVRKPYDRKPMLQRRRATFFGSTNRSEFLNDETGSVRWLCFEIDKINWEYKKDINITKVWHYAYKLLMDGFDYNLKFDEIAENETRNTSYNITNIEEELIIETLIPSDESSPDSKFLTSTKILLLLTSRYYLKSTLSIYNVGKALIKLNFIRDQKYNGKYQEKGYWVIVKPATT